MAMRNNFHFVVLNKPKENEMRHFLTVAAGLVLSCCIIIANGHCDTLKNGDFSILEGIEKPGTSFDKAGDSGDGGGPRSKAFSPIITNDDLNQKNGNDHHSPPPPPAKQSSLLDDIQEAVTIPLNKNTKVYPKINMDGLQIELQYRLHDM